MKYILLFLSLVVSSLAFSQGLTSVEIDLIQCVSNTNTPATPVNNLVLFNQALILVSQHHNWLAPEELTSEQILKMESPEEIELGKNGVANCLEAVYPFAKVKADLVLSARGDLAVEPPYVRDLQKLVQDLKFAGAQQGAMFDAFLLQTETKYSVVDKIKDGTIKDALDPAMDSVTLAVKNIYLTTFYSMLDLEVLVQHLLIELGPADYPDVDSWLDVINR